jgi:hypothetical protein
MQVLGIEMADAITRLVEQGYMNANDLFLKDRRTHWRNTNWRSGCRKCLADFA